MKKWTHWSEANSPQRLRPQASFATGTDKLGIYNNWIKFDQQVKQMLNYSTQLQNTNIKLFQNLSII